MKKKFVLETNYCITLDRVPEELYPQIVTNEKQKEEWIKLFAINEIKEYSGKLTIDFLKNNPFLVLDTAFFDTEFKYKLLASIDDFDKQCDGLLIHSENFQALNLLQEKQKEKIKCTYIDPPYNIGGDGFVYKDGYSHSSWLSMMKDRLQLARDYLTEDGVIFISIDDNEVDNLRKLCDEIFGMNNWIANIIWQKKYSPQNDAKWFSTMHDFIICIAKNKLNWYPRLLERTEEQNSRYTNRDNDPRGPWKSSDLSVKTYSAEYDYPIVTPSGRSVSLPAGRCWMTSKENMRKLIEDNRIWFGENEDNVPSLKRFLSEVKQGITPSTIWLRTEVGDNQEGKQELVNIIYENLFQTPKVVKLLKFIIKLASKNNVDTYLDYFAGSATTGHAVIKLNREDGGKRKYILVEMGNYFDLVTKPRIEKVIYSEDWKNGKPVSRKGSSHCFKYIRLESYEDALDNLKVERSAQQSDLLSKPQNKEIKEEYILNYMMDLETQGSLLNVSDFEHPFDYEMKITRDGETKTVKVDLVETFNYLIGLNVESIRKSKEIVAIEGRTRAGEKTLVLWRDTAVVDNKTLDNWFEKQNYSTQDMEFDTIYVNGNNNLENLRKGDETWKVRLTEAEFLKRMFDVKDV